MRCRVSPVGERLNHVLDDFSVALYYTGVLKVANCIEFRFRHLFPMQHLTESTLGIWGSEVGGL